MKALILLIIVTVTSGGLPLRANNPRVEATDTSILWGYGRKLQAEKKFQAAILEYNRLLYQFPGFTSKNMVYLRIGQCYDSIAQPGQAHRFYEEALQATLRGDPLTQWLLILNARNQIAAGKFAPALAELYALDTQNLSSEQADIYHLLSFVALHELGSTDQGKPHLFRLGVDQERIVEYERALSAAQHPNPNAAMIMSAVLPGLGQMYSGSKQEAVNSLSINAFFLALTLRTAQFLRPFDLIVAVLPWFQRYYVGGYNRASILAHQKQIKKRTIALELMIQGIPRERFHTLNEHSILH